MNDLVYVIYISGLIGLFKGVQVYYGVVGVLIEGMIEVCGIDSCWYVFWFFNYVFDVFYFDVFIVFGFGGIIFIMDQDILMQDFVVCVNVVGVEQLMIMLIIFKFIFFEWVLILMILFVCGEFIIFEIVSVWVIWMDVYNGYGMLFFFYYCKQFFILIVSRFN